MYAHHVRLRDTEWLTASPQVQARIRYKSPAVDATLTILPEQDSEGYGTILLRFSQPVWGVTPGQSLVLYKENLVVGGGIIQC